MDDLKALIEALNIFLKYGNPQFPTHCEHDVMYVAIEPEQVSEEDKKKLSELGFEPDSSHEMFSSYTFGSC